MCTVRIMLKMASEAVPMKTVTSQFGSLFKNTTQVVHSHKLHNTSTFLACASMGGKNNLGLSNSLSQSCLCHSISECVRELPFLLFRSIAGLFALKKKIEDVVLRTELIATAALEHEEARRMEQEEMIRNYDLWNDPSKSNDILVELVDSARAVDALKDLTYKVIYLSSLDLPLPKTEFRASSIPSIELASVEFCRQRKQN